MPGSQLQGVRASSSDEGLWAGISEKLWDEYLCKVSPCRERCTCKGPAAGTRAAFKEQQEVWLVGKESRVGVGEQVGGERGQTTEGRG